MHEFTVYGKVRGKGRPRVTRNGTYTPKETVEYEKRIRQAFIDSGGRSFGDGPIRVEVHAFRALPKSRPKSVVSEPDTFRLDWDNLGKCLDALNPIMDRKTGEVIFEGAWNDDAQIVDARVVKHPRTRCTERLVIRIFEEEGTNDHELANG